MGGGAQTLILKNCSLSREDDSSPFTLSLYVGEFSVINTPTLKYAYKLENFAYA